MVWLLRRRAKGWLAAQNGVRPKLGLPVRQLLCRVAQHVERDGAEGGELAAGDGQHAILLPQHVVARFFRGVGLAGVDHGAHASVGG